MNISGAALKTLIYVALEEHEVTREKIHRNVSESIYKLNRALEELQTEGLISIHKINDDYSHYWVFVITNEGRGLVGYLGQQLRDVYVP